MVKKIGVPVVFVFAVICLSAPLFAQDQPAAPMADEMLPEEEATGEGVITGDVTSLDATAGTITVKAEDGAEKAFTVVDGETILWKGIEDIKLSDIKKGDKAEVGYYTDDSGKLIASWVDVIVPEPITSGSTQGVQPTGAATAVPEEE